MAELLVTQEAGPRVARAVLGHQLFAPQLLVPELISTLRGWVLGGHLEPPRAVGALDDFRALDVTVLDMLPLIDDVWGLRANITPYDAMYVALARGMRSPLVTLDARLIAALPADVAALDL